MSYDGTLDRFLSNYEKISYNHACKQDVKALDLSVWTNRDGHWYEHRLSPALKSWPFKSESWCRLYLRGVLRLSPDEYTTAKNRLFSGRDVSGVYANIDQPSPEFPKFALVYYKS
jgi:hypothetical protein